MIRQIIHIDEEKCNGCGSCANACHESAIGIVDGKAKLLRDDYCDGMGDCLPNCPTGAITFEQREADAYDEDAVAENKKKKAIQDKISKLHSGGGCPGSAMRQIRHDAPTGAGPVPAPQGSASAGSSFTDASAGHTMPAPHGTPFPGGPMPGSDPFPAPQGAPFALVPGPCPAPHATPFPGGPMAGPQGGPMPDPQHRPMTGPQAGPAPFPGPHDEPDGMRPCPPMPGFPPMPGPQGPMGMPPMPQSRLTNWPVQIKLAPLSAPYYDKAKLLIAADCTAFTYASFHEDFIKGKTVLIGCPKLDNVDYSEKLTRIIADNNIKSVTIVRMEVPCCGGLERAVIKAMQASGKYLPWQVYTISIEGKILD